MAAPYSNSDQYKSAIWDWDGIVDAAPGSDLFPITWHDNGHLYTAFADGGGFGGNNVDGRVSLGVARVEGGAESWTGYNVWGGKNPESVQATEQGKCNGGILSLGADTLYMFIQEQSTEEGPTAWDQCELWKSTDDGMTWSLIGGDWFFEEPDGLFNSPAVVQYGQNYADNSDGYVYMYGQPLNTSQGRSTSSLYLARVTTANIETKGSYQYFSGTTGSPAWSSNVADAVAVFTVSGLSWGTNAFYNAERGRIWLTARHHANGWGIYDATNPYGPWTTIYHIDLGWLDAETKFTYVFNSKWMDIGGNTYWMVFSGDGDYDRFNVIKLEFVNPAVKPAVMKPLL